MSSEMSPIERCAAVTFQRNVLLINQVAYRDEGSTDTANEISDASGIQYMPTDTISSRMEQGCSEVPECELSGVCKFNAVEVQTTAMQLHIQTLEQNPDLQRQPPPPAHDNPEINTQNSFNVFDIEPDEFARRALNIAERHIGQRPVGPEKAAGNFIDAYLEREAQKGINTENLQTTQAYLSAVAEAVEHDETRLHKAAVEEISAQAHALAKIKIKEYDDPEKITTLNNSLLKALLEVGTLTGFRTLRPRLLIPSVGSPSTKSNPEARLALHIIEGLGKGDYFEGDDRVTSYGGDRHFFVNACDRGARYALKNRINHRRYEYDYDGIRDEVDGVMVSIQHGRKRSRKVVAGVPTNDIDDLHPFKLEELHTLAKHYIGFVYKTVYGSKQTSDGAEEFPDRHPNIHDYLNNS